MASSTPAFTWESFQYADRVEILVVDDVLLIRRLVRQVLFGVGLTHVREAASGEEAFQEICRRPPDLLITDFVMQPGDGIELVRDIRSRPESPNPFLPVIMLSGALSPRCFTAARDAGVDEFVVKPFTADALLTRVRAVTERPRPFVIAPGYVGPSRRRRQAASNDPRRGTGEATARILPPPRLVAKRLAGDAEGHETLIGEGLATLRAAQQSWTSNEFTELEAVLRQLRQSPPTPERYRALCRHLETFAARLALTGIGAPATVARLLKQLIVEAGDEESSEIIDLHLDSLLLLVAGYRRGKSPALFDPLASELTRLVAKQQADASAARFAVEGLRPHHVHQPAHA